MGVKVLLHHHTQYTYAEAAALGPQIVRLRPAPHCRTPILSYSLQVAPAGHTLYWRQEPEGNQAAMLLFPGKTKEFSIDVELETELNPFNPFDFLLDPEVEVYPFRYPREHAAALQTYLSISPAGPRLQEFVRSLPQERAGAVSFLSEVNRRVCETIAYGVRLEQGVQNPEETLESKAGSCRDFAWLLVQTLRHCGIAARFASGYLIQLSDQPEAGDSAALHAWTEVFLSGAGWIGLDPTSGLFAGSGHIPLACAAEPGMAAPVDGTAELRSSGFDYRISVRRVAGELDFSAPFSEAGWARVEKIACQVDEDLVAGDVRLTMGGEPTFVGLDDTESPQWNTAALGDLKRTRGLILIERLRNELAPGALLHFGQGKWYPGEPLPRWALGCYWRVDGAPLWEDTKLIALEHQGSSGNKPSLSHADALRFLTALATRLEVSPESILPAFHPELAEPAGYVLPIRRRQYQGRLYWSSQPWFPPVERLSLFPGESAIGYRLPVELIPWVTQDEMEYPEDERSPGLDKIPSAPVRRPDLFGRVPAPDPLPPAPKPSGEPKEEIRPAVCAEVRENRLHIFVPYTSKLSDYLDLLSAVEDTCRHLRMPIWVEGYAPPADIRLRSLSLTPDPGVLEVNLPPAANWSELQRFHTIVFEHARSSRLTGEKFTYEGRHTATGGGSHIVIGGPELGDSPLLRRPHLLRSLLTFWQNHPSLSYLFSGTFIGPTSQYPRVDEIRLDALYELEIAFSQLRSGECPPEILDGLFRNLLVDLTGNTHRAEFCIDKLYPPPGLGLRLGLLELRAFEMTPHVQMLLVQLLLVRALVARFWSEPYEGKLIRWGAALHDRFLLPYFVKQDFSGVLSFLRQGGYAFEDEWFSAHFAFRFPKIGSVDVNGLELELRQALEPWHVLGEEATSGGVVRNVDSSLERLQVKLTGSGPLERYAVVCNGRKVPLRATGEAEEAAVAGLRYRVRRLPSTLHPTIPVQTPLHFDIVDCWHETSIGRCAYLSSPPDGREYLSRPLNVAEAEARRHERFQRLPPGEHRVKPPADEVNPAFPWTLDLRWPSSASPLGSAIRNLDS